MSDLKLALTLSADGRQLVGEVKGARQAVSSLNRTLGQTSGQGQQAARGLGQLEQQSQRTGAALNKVGQLAVGTVAGLSAFQLGQQLTRELASFQDIRTRLQTLTADSADYARQEQYLIQTARDHHKALVPMADAYARLLNLREGGLVSGEQARTLLEGMSNAQSAMGATTVQLNQSMYGLSQALASPVVRAEELNQVVEPMPGLLVQLDRAAGVAAGGFRQLVLEGKVTSQMFRDKLLVALSEYQGAAAATADNLNAKYNDLTLTVQQLALAYEAPISDSLSAVIGATNTVLLGFTNNAESVITLLEVTMAAALARGAQGLAGYLAAQLASVRASEAQRQAAIAAAQAELHRATVQRQVAVGATMATAAEARLTAARTALTTATQRATLAGRAFNGVMALAGGPAGVVMMGVAALGSLAYQALTSGDALEKTRQKADGLKDSLLGLSEAQFRIRTANYANHYRQQVKAMAALSEQIMTLEQQQQRLRDTQPARDAAVPVRILQDQIDDLRAQRGALDAELQQLSDRYNQRFDGQHGNKTPNRLPNEGEANPEFDRLFANLQRQTALYGQASEAVKLRYDLEQGALKSLAPHHKAQLLAQAEALDGARAAAEQAKASEQAEKERQRSLEKLLATLDPLGTAQRQLAEAEALLTAHFEAANLPLKQRQQLLAALRAEHEAGLPGAGAFETLQRQLDPGYAEQQNHQENMGLLENELAQTPEEAVAKRQQINLLIEAEQQRHAEAMNGINQGIAFHWDTLWQQSVDRMSAGIGQATADAIFESRSFGEATKSVLKGVGKAAVQMLVEWMTQKALAAALDKTLITSTGATAAGTAAGTGAAIAASMAPAAATASIATMGGASTAGIAALSGAMAMLPSIIGIAHDGLPINRNEGTYLIRRDEMMLNPKQRENFEMMVAYAKEGQGAGNRSVVVQQHNTIQVANQAEADTLEEVLPQLVEMTKSAVVDDLNQRGEVWRAG
ncbi:tape measure protein [Ferrimonas balearica]|uniref:tape measure protein n=1 Tax=Ferrimonas balearica TaxID=44012 RepID=UPI001C94C8A7|nr:tape measure protein [Ferrimonas balearica]MBY6223557.1 tape measure protein [Ferrimonas balearica]